MKPRLAFIVFISGAVVMILELVGSRVVAPHLGSSTFVWTSLIGTVLGALSLGYYLGGHYADRSPSYQKLGWILFAAAISVLLTTLSKDILALIVRGNIEDLRLASIVTSIFLFGPTSILLGMVSPYCIRLAMKDLDHSGATVGNLYAISTAGSILGTFLGGFWLISFLGTTLILYTLSTVLLILSLVAARTSIAIPVGVLLTLLANLAFNYNSNSAWKNVIDLDTDYQRVWIFNSSDGNRAVRMLATGPYGYQSGMFLDTREPTSGYLSTFATVIDGFQQRKDILAIGGAGIILPRRLAERYPQSSIHVVELDPGMTSVARNFFGLTDLPNLTIEHLDGRMFLNKTSKSFDLIILDAFTGCISIPFHLITEEALREVARLLKPRGIVLQNVIGALEGDASIVTQHLVRTFQQAFPHVSVYPVHPQMPAYKAQNLAVVASHHPISELSGLSNKWDPREIDSLQPFTDDYAPLDYQMLAVYKTQQN